MVKDRFTIVIIVIVLKFENMWKMENVWKMYGKGTVSISTNCNLVKL